MRSTAVQFLTRSSGAWRPFFIVCLLFVQAFGIALCHGQSGLDKLHVYTVYGMAECVSGQTGATDTDPAQMGCIINNIPSQQTESSPRYCASSTTMSMMVNVVAVPVAPLPEAITLAQERQDFGAPPDVSLPEDPFIGIPEQPPRFA